MANLKAPPPPEPTIHEYVAHAAAAAELKAAQARHTAAARTAGDAKRKAAAAK
jgi:hypothetical protein